MLFWNQVIEILRESIFAYTQACNGNLGAGILAVTFLARLALLPLGIRVARAAADQQRAMARLQPALHNTAARPLPKRRPDAGCSSRCCTSSSRCRGPVPVRRSPHRWCRQ